MKQAESGSTAAPPVPCAAPPCEPGLESVLRQFPGDVQVAIETANKLRLGPPTPPLSDQEPWPPMRMPA